jgi:hypothetical protein
MEAAMTDPVSMAGTGGLAADHPVNRQLDAYNHHRLDEFVACFAPAIRLTTSDGTMRAEGHEHLRSVYVPVFEVPGRRASIANRIAVGAWVIDHEVVFDDSGRRFEAAVAYHLVDGEIVEMRVFD